MVRPLDRPLLHRGKSTTTNNKETMEIKLSMEIKKIGRKSAQDMSSPIL
jgi:hypothetical protein